MFIVTPLYAGLLGLLLVALSLNASRARMAQRVSVGDGGNTLVMKAMRTQANFVEYAPMAVLLLALLEAQGAPHWALHALGAALFIGRILHAYGFGRTPQIVLLRRIGIVLTFLMLTLTALANIAYSLC
jgi:uncharacterized membrane protein YecN with MAPEG domain